MNIKPIYCYITALIGFTLVPKLQLGNPDDEALASRVWKQELTELSSWSLGASTS